ncbi:unnamed protein product [Rotaria socialis]|uniref:TIR domain-containing protein n=1 Tax=Rotaria socialis TaxID=392032 RepID=A0A818LM00_9BILA|nr:unnamed protein product [Rotaria socialis]
MASSSSSPSFFSNRNEDLKPENIEPSVRDRNQEMVTMESCTNMTQQTKQLCDDDDDKTSVSVEEETKVIVRQGQSAVEQIRILSQEATILDSNASSQDSIRTHNGGISEIDIPINNSGPTPPTVPTTDISQSPISVANTQNSQQESRREKHIMISYNQATSLAVCQKIYDYLKARNYNVWFDQVDLHGSIINGMGEAVDNSYVILLCINTGYEKSAFCSMEAKYAIEKRIPVIPCMMEENFRPKGGLGIIKSDLKHIEFFYEDKFDESMEKLISEIKFFARPLEDTRTTEANMGQLSSETTTTATTMTSPSTNHTNFCARFNTIICEHILSVQNRYLRRENLNENEFGKVLHTLIQEFSPESLQSFETIEPIVNENRHQQEIDNDRLLQHFLQRNEQFAESIRMQQHYNDHIQQHRYGLDERLAAFLRFQEKQEQENTRFSQIHVNHNDRLISIVDVQQRNYASIQQQYANQNELLAHISRKQQEQERNNRISEQLLQHVEQYTQLFVNQQQQSARDTAALYQLINRSLERNESLESIINHRLTPQAQQEPAEGRFNFDTLNKLIQTIILLWILIILLKNT